MKILCRRVVTCCSLAATLASMYPSSPNILSMLPPPPPPPPKSSPPPNLKKTYNIPLFTYFLDLTIIMRFITHYTWNAFCGIHCILRLPSCRRAALGLYVNLTLWWAQGANQRPYALLHNKSSPRNALRHRRLSLMVIVIKHIVYCISH